MATAKSTWSTAGISGTRPSPDGAGHIPVRSTTVTVPVGSGSGLGLAISKTLVEMMGGELMVESLSNEGSTFSFSLLFSISEIPVFKRAESKLQKVFLQPLKILLAEDTEINQIYLSFFLEKQGHTVVVVDNGQSVLGLLRKEQFDLILMDIQMPIVDGITATRKIRNSNSEYSNIPIIALTAFAYKSDKEIFLTEGMNGYVSKPVDYNKLLTIISEIIPDKCSEKSVLNKNQVIGLHDLELRYRNSKELLEKIFEIFLQETPGKMIKLKAALDKKDSDTSRKLSHSLTNTTGTINALHSHEYARALETSIMDNNFKEAFDHYSDLYSELQKVYSYLRASSYVKKV